MAKSVSRGPAAGPNGSASPIKFSLGAGMINRKMSIEEVVKKHPETIATFERHGLGCLGCQAALFESIEQGAEVHGIDADALIADLNKEVKRTGAGNGK